MAELSAHELEALSMAALERALDLINGGEGIALAQAIATVGLGYATLAASAWNFTIAQNQERLR